MGSGAQGGSLCSSKFFVIYLKVREIGSPGRGVRFVIFLCGDLSLSRDLSSGVQVAMIQRNGYKARIIWGVRVSLQPSLPQLFKLSTDPKAGIPDPFGWVT